jgi:hypothetical protein
MQHPDVIVSVDGNRCHFAENPVVWDLRPIRIDAELRRFRQRLRADAGRRRRDEKRKL